MHSMATACFITLAIVPITLCIGKHSKLEDTSCKTIKNEFRNIVTTIQELRNSNKLNYNKKKNLCQDTENLRNTFYLSPYCGGEDDLEIEISCLEFWNCTQIKDAFEARVKKLRKLNELGTKKNDVRLSHLCRETDALLKTYDFKHIPVCKGNLEIDSSCYKLLPCPRMKELFQSEVKKIQALRPIDTRNDREKFIRLYKGCVEIRKECGHCEENFELPNLQIPLDMRWTCDNLELICKIKNRQINVLSLNRTKFEKNFHRLCEEKDEFSTAFSKHNPRCERVGVEINEYSQIKGSTCGHLKDLYESIWSANDSDEELLDIRAEFYCRNCGDLN